MGLSQLTKLSRFLARRYEIARQYDTALARAPLATWLVSRCWRELSLG